jgi:glutamyl-tRNA reductase
MPVQFIVFGLNHQSAPIAIRESFELSAEQRERLVRSVREYVSGEWMVVSTCNRTEFILYGRGEEAGRLRAAVAEVAGAPWPPVRAFCLQGRAAVEHVLAVTSGLQSQVLGDVQILNQVKAAYRAAHEAGTVGPTLHRLMHTAFATAKRVLTETGVSRGNPSIASLATRMARRLVAKQHPASEADPARALVLGSGEMGGRILQILSHDRAVKALVSNRTQARAQDLAAQYGATVVPWEARVPAVAMVDVVFVTTASRAYVLDADAAPPRTERPALVIDLSVPRNVDPLLNRVAGYRVLDLDALQAIEQRELETQALGVDEAQAFCREAAEAFLEWEHTQRLLKPVIETLTDAFESVRKQEVEKNIHRIDAAFHDQVDHLTRSIVQKLLAIPVVHLKRLPEGKNGLEQQVAVLAGLFTRPECEE